MLKSGYLINIYCLQKHLREFSVTLICSGPYGSSVQTGISTDLLSTKLNNGTTKSDSSSKGSTNVYTQPTLQDY